MSETFDKAYHLSVERREWLHTVDCSRVLVQFKAADIKTTIEALRDNVRITGLAAGYYVRSLVAFTLRVEQDDSA